MMNFGKQMDNGRRKVAVLIAAVFASSVVVASLERTVATPARAPLSGELTGTFTGETTADGPVYRLPPLHVVADRGTEYARIGHEEQRERARAARAGAAEQKPGV
jgi:triosephosphate isomerase